MTPSPHIVLNQPEPPSEPVPVSEEDIQKILGERTAREHVQFRSVEVVFMSPEEIIEINKKYLNHDYVTDIITFRLDEPSGDGEKSGIRHGNQDGKALVNESIEGTLCCCDDQIRKQSKELKTGEREEFLRVVIHGMLHLCGWEDETAEQRAAMRARENVYLGLMDTV